MAKKKFHWYVLVLTSEGAKFVTENNYKTKYSHWDDDKSPLEMSMGEAEDVAFGLTLNGHQAFPVKCFYEKESQPYRYTKGHFEWKWDEEKEKKDAE